MSVENVSETVAKVLASQRENESKYKSIEVFKEVEPNIDIGNLLLNDLQPVSTQEFKRDKETYLKTLSRNNLQLLFNQIWKLPIERIENAVVVKLPEGTTLLPREKPIPKPKAPTKWEEYAKKKDIQNKKRTRMVWDEEAGKYKPRTGYQRANDNTKEWCIEVPVNAKDDKEDQFEKHENEKKERVAKNELKRLSNIARNSKNKQGSILSSQLKPTQKKDKERVTKEIDVAKVSTASMGKFQQKLPKEKENKKQGKKRKFDSVTANSTKEKDRALEILKKINKPNQVDLTSAVNKKVAQTQLEESSQKKKGSGKVKNKRFRKGKQSTMDKMKGKTLGKGRKKK